MDLKAYHSLITQTLPDYVRTGKGEYAAHTIELLGMVMRELGIEPVDQPTIPETVTMAVKAMEYWQNVTLCSGDSFDQAFRCDGLVTGFNLGFWLLRNHKQEHSILLAAARCAIAEVEEQVGEPAALDYIRRQPPMLFFKEAHGIWRRYYAIIMRNPNAQPNEYPEIAVQPS